MTTFSVVCLFLISSNFALSAVLWGAQGKHLHAAVCVWVAVLCFGLALYFGLK